jgi:hypothetical protein
MSWLFSQALVAEYLGENFSDGEPSAPSNGNLTQLAYLSQDKMTKFSRLSRFGMTFKPLMESLGEELLMLFREDFHAKTLALPEEATDLTENDQACGITWRAWLAKYDLATSSWKTPQCSLLGEEPESLETLPRWGMTVDGLLWEQPTLEPITKETESGFWPTPIVCGNYNRPGASATSGMGLATAVKLWPTPNAGSPRWGGTMQEWGGSKNWVRKEMPELAGGPLNPTWVEWLMGWPLGWTALKPLEMDKSHCVQPPPGES